MSDSGQAVPNSGASSEKDIYLRIFEHSKDSVFLITPETGQIVFANPKAVEDTSYEAPELDGLDFRSLFLPEDQAAINTLLETTLQWKTGVDPQRNLKRKTGRKIIVEISSSIVEFQGKQTLFCNVRDITARIKAEEKIKQYSKELETINAELEERVKARTADLASANEKLNETNNLITLQKKELDDVMSNIKQAIFTVSKELKINPEHSKFVGEVFGAKTARDSQIAEFLFEPQDLETKGKGLIDALNLAYEQPDTWDLVKDLLPRELKYSRPAEDGSHEFRDLNFEWVPILLEGGTISKFMVVCLDITEQKKLQEAIAKQEAAHNEQLELISHLINLPSEIVSQFVRDSLRMLNDLKELVAQVKALDGSVTEEITTNMMRTMHTLKGSSRQFGLKSVQNRAHELESKVSTAKTYDQQMYEEFELLEKALVDVHVFYEKTVGGKGGGKSEGEQISVSMKKIDTLFEYYPAARKRVYSDSVYQSVHWLIRVPVRNLFDELEKLALSLAEELTKEVKVEKIGNDIQMDYRILGPLNDAFLHVVRNMMDHGAELPDEREAVGKERAVHLRFSLKIDSGYLCFEFADDGRGVDVEKVKARALSKGLTTEEKLKTATEEDIIHFIFLPGFSTKEVTTELSGRGVGMDVVKDTIEKKLSGEVKMHSQSGKGSSLKAKVPLLAMAKKPLPHYLVKSSQTHREEFESSLGIPFQEISEKEIPDLPGNLILPLDTLNTAETYRKSQKNIIVFGQLPPKEMVNQVLLQNQMSHFIDSTNSFTFPYLEAVLHKLSHGPAKGLEAYLAPGSTVNTHQFTVYAEKNSMIEQLNQFTQQMRAFRGMPEILATIADEMIMNGMFDAPRDENGQEKYNKLPRNHPLVLEPQEAITFRYGADSQFIGVSVEDPFGALTYDTLVKYLKRCYDQNSNQIEQKQGGAGLGLFTIFDNAHCFIVNSIPGKKTEIIALISLSMSFAKYQGTGKSFSFFIEGENGI